MTSTETDLPRGTALTAHRMGTQDDRYVVAADIGPEGEWTSSQPFEVTIRPSELLD